MKHKNVQKGQKVYKVLLEKTSQQNAEYNPPIIHNDKELLQVINKHCDEIIKKRHSQEACEETEKFKGQIKLIKETFEENLVSTSKTIEGLAHIQNKLNKEVKPQQQPLTQSWGLTESIGIAYRGLCCCTEALKNTLETKIFREAHHPSKQKKYENALTETKIALEEYKVLSLLTKTDLGKLVENITKNIVSACEDPRKTYYQFLVDLREALEGQNYKQELTNKLENKNYDTAVDVLLYLCKVRYCDIHLYSYCKQLVYIAIESGCQSKEEKTLTLTSSLHKLDFTAIESTSSELKATVATNLGKFKGSVNIGFDTAFQQNIPFTAFTVGMLGQNAALKKVLFLRMGSPTIEGAISAARVSPEFRNFIQYCAFHNQKHLYVSFQNEDPEKCLGSEVGRNRAIKALKNDFPNTFDVIVLDQDSDFYYQDSYSEAIYKEKFIETFKEKLFNENRGYYFPNSWLEDPIFIDQVDKLFTITIEILDLSNKIVLTKDERKDFIEIYNTLVFIYSIHYSNADSVNGTCKDSIDRAMKTLSLSLQVIFTAIDKQHDPAHQEMQKVYTHAPAFMTKKQAMIPARRSRLLSALERLKTEQAIKIIKQHHKILGISEETYIHLVKRQNQEFAT